MGQGWFLSSVFSKRIELTGENSMSNLEEVLRQMVEVAGRRKIPTYAQFVLDNGRYYEPTELPKGYRLMTPQRCFDNAFKLACKKGLTYVEGYAEIFGVPILHGWCLDGETVIDPTTTGLGGYYGVPLKLSLVKQLRAEKKNTFSILDDWLNGHRFLAGLETLDWRLPVPEVA